MAMETYNGTTVYTVRMSATCSGSVTGVPLDTLALHCAHGTICSCNRPISRFSKQIAHSPPWLLMKSTSGGGERRGEEGRGEERRGEEGEVTTH